MVANSSFAKGYRRVTEKNSFVERIRRRLGTAEQLPMQVLNAIGHCNGTNRSGHFPFGSTRMELRQVDSVHDTGWSEPYFVRTGRWAEKPLGQMTTGLAIKFVGRRPESAVVIRSRSARTTVGNR